MLSSCRSERLAVRVAVGVARRPVPFGHGWAIAVFAALIRASVDVAVPVRADSKVVDQFLEHHLTGCVRW